MSRAGKERRERIGYRLPWEFIEKYNLTNREVKVTEVLLQGKTDRDIGALLEIALNTAQVHLKHIYKKTGMKSRYGLMASIGFGQGR